MSGDETLQQYLGEGLVALLPVYRGGVEGTEVFTLAGSYQLYHSLSWELELLARYFCLDLGALRRQSGRLLGVRHHIPLPFSPLLLLLPVKVRRGEELGERTSGYVNLLQVKGVDLPATPGKEELPVGETSPGPARHGGDGENCRSRIRCRGDVIIDCLNTRTTLKEKLRQGELLQEQLSERQRFLSAAEQKFNGLSGTALQELLPSCDCLLRSIALLLLEQVSGR